MDNEVVKCSARAVQDKIGSRMEFEVGPCTSPEHTTAWFVEAINYDDEGIIYRTEFLGHDAEERAREYAAWKNSQEFNSPLRRQ